MVGGRPEYPVEEMQEVEIIDECDSVTSECDTFMVCLFLSLRLYLNLTFHLPLLIPTELPLQSLRSFFQIFSCSAVFCFIFFFVIFSV